MGEVKSPVHHSNHHALSLGFFILGTAFIGRQVCFGRELREAGRFLFEVWTEISVARDHAGDFRRAADLRDASPFESNRDDFAELADYTDTLRQNRKVAQTDDGSYFIILFSVLKQLPEIGTHSIWQLSMEFCSSPGVMSRDLTEPVAQSDRRRLK